MNLGMAIFLVFMSSLFGIDRDNQSISERVGAINYHRMVLRSQEHENIMDKDIEDGIARRHPEMHEDFRLRKISPSDVRLILEIAIELIAFIKKIVDLHEKEDAHAHQQQVSINSSKDKENNK